MESIETLAERLLTTINAASRKIEHEFNEINNLPLTTPQLFLLHLLAQKDSWKVTELAETMTVQPSAITAMVDRLEQNRFVERERDEIDRRVVFLKISAEGKKVLKIAGEKRKEILINYLQHLKKEEIITMVNISEKLAHIILKRK